MAFRPIHYGLLALFGISTLALIAAPDGPLQGSTRTIFLLTLGAGLMHGVFHMWRHTVLLDGALRNITPRALHNIL